MKADRLTARALRRLLFAALQTVGDQIEDPLDENIRKTLWHNAPCETQLKKSISRTQQRT